MNILVLCTGNSARSILLECLLNDLGSGRVTAFSAGSHPAGVVNPFALIVLTAEGHGTQGLASKSWDVFAKADAPVMDVVITVCGNAAGETCPVWPGSPIRAYWGLEDPAAVLGTDLEKSVAFKSAYDRLKRRTAALLAKPFEDLAPIALSQVLKKIGEQP